MLRASISPRTGSSAPLPLLAAAIAPLLLAACLTIPAQQPAPPAAPPDAAPAQQAPAGQPQTSPTPTLDAAPSTQNQPAQPAGPAPAQALPAAATPSPANQTPTAGTEEDLAHLLVGKALYLRGGFLDNNLTFNEHGDLIGQSPRGSYTLSGVQIDHVHLKKHKLELEGRRFGLHFLGALPYEDPTKALDRVNITPKKKPLRITIDRELVVNPKKAHHKGAGQPGGQKQSSKRRGKGGLELPAETTSGGEPTPAEQAKSEIAAAQPEERPADPGSVTATVSPAHAAGVLINAIDRIFASGLDDRMMASMPPFWKFYYEAAAAKTDYRPADPAVLRQSMVDKKARLLSRFEPESNEFAQANAVAGMALYHAVIGPDGKPAEIAVARPIGFGLDENAVDAIRKASFEPAIKDGKPVPVLLDLVVEFRIYSKRTAARSDGPAAAAPAQSAPQLPGPYSVNHP